MAGVLLAVPMLLLLLLTLSQAMSTEGEIPLVGFPANGFLPEPPMGQRSIRKPKMSTWFNDADRIERGLQEDGHRTWGFVIYRTTYDSDQDWQEFLRRLRFITEDTFEYFNGMDILERFNLTVFEDRENLDGASTSQVREHFRQWRQTAPQTEQQDPENPDREIGPGWSPRYRYAVQVDAESLHAVVHEAPDPADIDTTKKGWVKIIDASWKPTPPDKIHYPYEPIDGIVQKNIGWMKVPYLNVMDSHYADSRDLRWWVVNYQRPPVVMGFPYGQ